VIFCEPCEALRIAPEKPCNSPKKGSEPARVHNIATWDQPAWFKSERHGGCSAFMVTTTAKNRVYGSLPSSTAGEG